MASEIDGYENRERLVQLGQSILQPGQMWGRMKTTGEKQQQQQQNQQWNIYMQLFEVIQTLNF